MRVQWYWGLAVLPLLAITPSGMASLLPTSWGLAASVDTFGPGGSGMTVGFFGPPQPSFHNQHSVTHGGSTISTQYDIEILQSMAEYNVLTQIICGNVLDDHPRCVTSGRIALTSTTDVWLDMASSYNYALPGDLMIARATVVVAHAETFAVLFGQPATDSTVSQGPHSGVFNLQSYGLIPAGIPVLVQYSFETLFLNGATNNIAALSTGCFHMTMSAVPEPTAVGLLAVCGLILVRKRTQRDNLSGR